MRRDPVLTSYYQCRICDLEALHPSLLVDDSVALCSVHDQLVRDAVQESFARGLMSHETMFGTWLGTGYDDDDGREFVVCSRDRGHSSVDLEPGTLCRWCLVNYADLVRYQREQVLGPLETDPEDVRYPSEVRQRHAHLLRAVEARIVTLPESLRALDRLLAPLGGANV